MKGEFYIGWEAKAPDQISLVVRRSVSVLLLTALILALGIATAQRTIGVASFEWGNLKTFSGILRTEPYPHLLVARPGVSANGQSQSTYHLVAPFKFGLDRSALAEFNGKQVVLKGTLIYRDTQTMIEAVPDSIRLSPEPANQSEMPVDEQPVSLGEKTFAGEIVDSKCYLGVMNPGISTPHRACAVRCISGGIPPVLLVRAQDGLATYLLLVSRDGQPVNKEVLNLVAEPVEIKGELVQQGNLLILKSDPASYRRIR